MPTFTGTDNDDTFLGSGLADVMRGLGGNDTLRGRAGDDRLFGGTGDDLLSGSRGSDALWGAGGSDTLLGGGDGDKLVGGLGRDTLAGGGDADSFQFHAVAHSTASNPDVIRDFELEEGDRINLKLLDADTTQAGDQAFEYVGKGSFSGDAGELRVTGGGYEQRVEGDVNGDKVADFAVIVEGKVKFSHPHEDGGSFVL